MVWTIPIVYGSLGAFSLVFQTILLREFFTVAAGNEISFAVALAGWLIGVGAGSYCAGLLSTRPRRPPPAFSWVVLSLCLMAPLLLAGIRCLQQLSGAPPGALIPLHKTFWLVPLLTIPFSFFSGFAFPLAVQLKTSGPESADGKVARAYIWECLGALAAGVAYTFWLLEKFNSFLIIAVFSLPLLLGSAWIAAHEKRKITLALHSLLLSPILFAILAGGANRLDSWLAAKRWQGLSSGRLVASRDSKYQNLQLGRMNGQYSLYANGQLAATFPDDEEQIIQAAQILTQHPQPRRVLIIGEGASGLAKHFLRAKIDSLTAVEMDGKFLDLIMNHLPAGDRESLGDARLRMPVLDGRRFVRLAARAKADANNRFDLVYLHQPDAWTAQLNRFYTREFFADLKKILNAGGVVALRVTSSENYSSEITNPYTATIYHTLKDVFPAIAVSPGPVNFFFASEAAASVSTRAALLSERYRRLDFPPPGLESIFSSLYPEEKTGFIEKALTARRVPDLNRDQRPIAYFLCSRLLGWTSGSPLSGMFGFFEKMSFIRLLLYGGLFFFIIWIFFRRKKVAGSFSVLAAAASGGYAGLSFEIIIIFTFQNIWGYVYQTIGLLIAAFMLGMGAGAFLAVRFLQKRKPGATCSRRILAGDQLLIAMTSLTCLPLLRFFAQADGLAGQIPIFVWLGGMGMLVGAILPLGLHLNRRQPAAKKAGLLNAADYLGGTFGALATASFFLPLYGSANCMLLIALLSLAASLLLLLETGPAQPA